MTTKAEILAAIEAVEARVERLTPAILAHVEARLPEGEWRVREALCHLAARSNSVPIAQAAAERVRANQGWGSYNIDEENAGQIADRQRRTTQDLLAEIHQGHRAETAAVAAFDDETLNQRMPKFIRTGDMSMADLLLAAGPGHDNMHLDQIEKAVGG